jgi:hypothetical protein
MVKSFYTSYHFTKYHLAMMKFITIDRREEQK